MSSGSSSALSVLPLSNLARNGSFSTKKMYTKGDLRELVKYASDRGIEIIPEIDMPAHSKSWGRAFKDVIVDCKRTAGAAETPVNVYPLDPSNPLTMEIITGVLQQISEIFPSKYLHVGGDEVSGSPCGTFVFSFGLLCVHEI